MITPKKPSYTTESQVDDTRLVASQRRKETDEDLEEHESRIKMISARHELDILEIDNSIILANLKLKQTQSIKGTELRFVHKLISGPWKQMVNSDQDCLSKLTETRIECMKEIASATIEFMYGEQLAMANCMKQTASALCQYYKALIMNRLAKMVLFRIAKTFKLDPEFRFKLEKPLKTNQFQLVNRKKSFKIKPKS